MSQFQKDEVIILTALTKILKDKRFVTMVLGVLATLLTVADPALVPYEPIIMVAMFALVALLVHGYTLTDVQNAGTITPLPTNSDMWLQILQEAIKALNANTSVVVGNNQVVSANTLATANNTVVAQTGQAISAPVPRRDEEGNVLPPVGAG